MSRNLQPLADPINDITRLTGHAVACDGPFRNSSDTSGNCTWLGSTATRGAAREVFALTAIIAHPDVVDKPPDHKWSDTECLTAVQPRRTFASSHPLAFPFDSPGQPRKPRPSTT